MEKNILDIIKSIVADYGEQIQNNFIKKPDENTHLYGQKSTIDSIGLVSIIVTTEQRLADELGVSITLADEKAMSQKNSPFLTIGTLARYIQKLVEE
jgi:D-alanine--poly(phosphoribitol) ligase subunit 2